MMPTRQRRIMLNHDYNASFRASCTPEPESADQVIAGIHRHIDELAQAGVDSTATTFFTSYFTLFDSKLGVTNNRMKDKPPLQKNVSRDWIDKFQSRFKPLIEAGGDPLQVQIRRAHHHGMEYLACFRMNDRHPGGGPFKMERGDLHIQDIKHYGEYRRGFDFTHDIVRENLLFLMTEVLEGYDVDGLELDWMRWCRMFPMDVAPQRGGILTQFIGQVRELLDKTADRRGIERMTLSVRVPQTLEECHALGFDVAAWVASGAMDCLVPNDFFYTDLVTKVEDFVALTEGTNCGVYPGLHPIVAHGDNVGKMTAENYRAAARNFYHFGASGVAAYNYQYHWETAESRKRERPTDMYPKALGFLTGLDEPEKLDGPRHYLFHALWDAPSLTGTVHDHDIRLDRGQTNPSGRFRFRVVETGGTLLFKAVGLTGGEKLSVTINGQSISEQAMTTDAHPEGQTKEQGHPWGPFVLYRIALATPPLVEGDNELAVELASNSAGSGTIEIREVEFISEPVDSGRS